MADARTSRPSGPRPPSLLDALLPIVVLIGLLALTIVLFGDRRHQRAAPGGAAAERRVREPDRVQERLHRRRRSPTRPSAASPSAMGAIFILLAVGALIGTWNMAGTIPTVVDYGIRLVSPTWFYLTAAVVCALVGMVTGSSWTTAGTLGVAFVGMSNVMGLDEAIAAGAVICGAYFGDKMTPLSETTILVPKLVGGGLTVGRARPEHVLDRRTGARASASCSSSCSGVNADPDADDQHRRGPRSAGDGVQHLGAQPAAAAAAGRASRSCKMPPFLSILGSALFAGVLAPFLQWDAVKAFVDDPSLGPVATGDQGRLRRDGHRASSATRACRADRRPVLPRRHGQHAHHDLAGPRRALVRRRDGARRASCSGCSSRSCPATRRRGSLIAAVNAQRHRPQRDRRRPVRRRRPARADVPQASSPGAGWRPRCCPGRSRTPAPSPRCWCRGTPAAPTSPACSASPPPPTSRSASSTCSARCSTSCTASSASRCPGRERPGRTTNRRPPRCRPSTREGDPMS